MFSIKRRVTNYCRSIPILLSCYYLISAAWRTREYSGKEKLNENQPLNRLVEIFDKNSFPFYFSLNLTSSIEFPQRVAWPKLVHDFIFLFGKLFFKLLQRFNFLVRPHGDEPECTPERPKGSNEFFFAYTHWLGAAYFFFIFLFMNRFGSLTSSEFL